MKLRKLYAGSALLVKRTGAQEMGLKLIEAVYQSALPKRLKGIAAVYAKCAHDKDGSSCHPGVDYVCQATGLKEAMVRRLRKELIDLGVLEADVVHTVHGKKVLVRDFTKERLPHSYVDSAPTPDCATPVADCATPVAEVRYSSSDIDKTSTENHLENQYYGKSPRSGADADASPQLAAAVPVGAPLTAPEAAAGNSLGVILRSIVADHLSAQTLSAAPHFNDRCQFGASEDEL
jgi:hypothetical protein